MEMYLTTPDRQNLMTKKADIQWGAPQRGVDEITVDVNTKLFISVNSFRLFGGSPKRRY